MHDDRRRSCRIKYKRSVYNHNRLQSATLSSANHCSTALASALAALHSSSRRSGSYRGQWAMCVGRLHPNIAAQTAMYAATGLHCNQRWLRAENTAGRIVLWPPHLGWIAANLPMPECRLMLAMANAPMFFVSLVGHRDRMCTGPTS